MMEECKSCFHFDRSDTYPDIGICKMWDEVVDVDGSCEDHVMEVEE